MAVQIIAGVSLFGILPQGGAAYLGVRSSYDQGTIWARSGHELGASCSVVGYKPQLNWITSCEIAGCTNWVRTACELGTGMPSSRLPSRFLNRRGRGGERWEEGGRGGG